MHPDLVPSITGFKLIKQKVRKKIHKGYKISGGIAVFAKNEISHMVKYAPTKSEEFIWIKFITDEHEENFIVTAHISPSTKN